MYSLQKFSISSSRDFDKARFEAVLREVLDYLEKNTAADPAWKVFGLFENGKLIGYSLLQFGEFNPVLMIRQGYIFDIGVEPSAWGRYRWKPLTYTMIDCVAKSSYRVIGAAITSENLRTLRIATHFVKLRTVRKQWMKKLK